MGRRWTTEEESKYRKELLELYVRQNKTIEDISHIVGITQSSVFKRMRRLNIYSNPHTKQSYLNTRRSISFPKGTKKLAEFVGIMLGDGNVTHFQTKVTLGTKELPYIKYVASLMSELFKTPATICVRSDGYRDVYINSVLLTAWLKKQGLASNKVVSQVDVPAWVSAQKDFMQGFLRGFFDTDGSYYLLRYGKQISLTNHSLPLLRSLRKMLIALDYRPSEVSAGRVYLTRKGDIDRFFNEVRPANTKHLRRYKELGVGTQAVNEEWL